LDLGCGTGIVTVPLSTRFATVKAVDCNDNMLDVAKEEAAKAKCNNIDWICDSAENFMEKLPETELFDVVTIAHALHWMKAAIVLPLARKHLKPNGCLVVIGSAHPFLEGEEDWKKKLNEIFKKFFDFRKNELLSTYSDPHTNWGAKLPGYEFLVEQNYIEERREWTVETAVNYMRSLSAAKRSIDLDGPEHFNNFEKDVRAALLAINPENKFVEEYKVSVVIAENKELTLSNTGPS
jgi:2-polyprenyl-3-methyl-5-hydroxy-6-metoxy-1,4-benzoquinol methylase